MLARSAASNPVRRRGSGPQTRAEIVAAAEVHFAERGFEAARLEDIAAEVGIRRAAIFYHFGDKQELYAAVLDEVFGGWTAALPAAAARPSDSKRRCTGWIDYVARHPSVARLILREAANAQPGVVVAVRSRRQRTRRVVPGAHRRGRGLGRAEADHRALSVHQPDGRDHGVPLRRDALAHVGKAVRPLEPSELEKHKREILLVARTMLGHRIAATRLKDG